MCGEINSSRSKTNYTRGVEAEDYAASHLERDGYSILQRRYKTKFGEVDLIVLRDRVLCFVEVKARPVLADALDAVTIRTRRRIEKSALYFISQNIEYTDYDMRFDVVAVTEGEEITHLDNAWYAGA